MRLPVTAAVALSLLLLPLSADAKPKNGRGNGNGHAARSESGFCPPGLRDRNPPCVPPGQARQEERRGEVERLRTQPIEIDDPGPTGTAEPGEEWAGEIREAADQAEALVAAATILDVLRRAPVRTSLGTEAEEAALRQPAPWIIEPEPVAALAPVPSLPLATTSSEIDVTAPAPALPRLVPLGEPLSAPVPTPEEEALLSDVFRRAAEEGSTGF